MEGVKSMHPWLNWTQVPFTVESDFAEIGRNQNAVRASPKLTKRKQSVCVGGCIPDRCHAPSSLVGVLSRLAPIARIRVNVERLLNTDIGLEQTQPLAGVDGERRVLGVRVCSMLE